MTKRARTYAVALMGVGWTMAAATMVTVIVVTWAVQPRGAEYVLGILGVPAAVSGIGALAITVAAAAAIGFILGTPFIAAGELILIALDQRRLLDRQVRAVRKIERRLAPRPAAGAVPKERAAVLVNRLARR